MGIIMAGLSPHPPLIIPEIGGKRRHEVQKTIDSLEELAEEIKAKDADLLITISPHGPVFTDAISILDREHLAGDFSDFSCPQVELEVVNKPDFIKKLKENAAQKDIEVITLSNADLEKFNFPAKLDHGVMVPLYYIQKSGVEVPVVPITMGLLDYQKLYEFGQLINTTLESRGENAVIIASGDLSHRLKPGAPAGYNPRGQEFDDKLVKLLQKEKYQDILNIDPQLIEKAGECGLRPLIIMLGAISNKHFKSDVKSYQGTFGVGYSVVGLYPEA